MRGGRKGGMYKGKGETERGAPRAAARHPVFHKLSKLFHRHKLQVPIASAVEVYSESLGGAITYKGASY